MTTALSIQIPDELAVDSAAVAKQLHMSRSRFIRLAIENEIKAYKLRKEQEKMVSSFQALRQDPNYIEDVEDIVNLETPLHDDEDDWWKT